MVAGPEYFARSITRGRYHVRPHLEYIGGRLAEIPEGDRWFVIEAAIRHGKSWLTSLWLPFWFLSLYPWKRIGLFGYSAKFAKLWGRGIRSLVRQYCEETGVYLDPESTSAASWNTDQGGGVHTDGAGGEITGRGFDLIIIDDPIKNSVQANSAVYRERLWDWWQSDVRSRVEPGGSVIVTMARWHEDDIIGRIRADVEDKGKEDEPDPWEFITLPGLCVDPKNDPLGRKQGEALWPERFPVPKLKRMRRAMGLGRFQALVQQSPTPPEGVIFRREFWFDKVSKPRHRYSETKKYYFADVGHRVIKIPKADCYILSTADLALTEKEENSATAIGAWAVYPAGKRVILMLLHMWRDWVQAPEAVKQLKRHNREYGPRVFGVEKKHYGMAVCQNLRRASGFPLRELKADRDKVSRAQHAAVMADNGMFLIPENAPWLDAFIDELLAFPKAKHDDQVDVASHAANSVVETHLGGRLVIDDEEYIETRRPRIEGAPQAPAARQIDTGYDEAFV